MRNLYRVRWSNDLQFAVWSVNSISEKNAVARYSPQQPIGSEIVVENSQFGLPESHGYRSK